MPTIVGSLEPCDRPRFVTTLLARINRLAAEYGYRAARERARLREETLRTASEKCPDQPVKYGPRVGLIDSAH